jgi:hypothetical protein
MRLLFFCFISTSIILAQNSESKLIHGKIVAQNALVGKIDIVNLVNEKATYSNSEGDFFILAKVGDVLVLESNNLEFQRKIISEDDLLANPFIVNMTPKAIELNEVLVSKTASEGTSFFSGQKTYSPAERKLHTATSGILDAPINWMTGRTAMLKKEVIVEKKERLLSRVSGLYSDDFYTKKLKIPFEYIEDFQYYMIDDKDFQAALKSKNKTMQLFLVSKLATNYRTIMANFK